MSNTYSIPVICMTEGCANRGEAVNVISGIEEEYLEAFYESFGDAEPEDYCPICGELGVAEDPELEEETANGLAAPSST